MATLILDLENDIDVEQFVSKISTMKEIKNIELKKNQKKERFPGMNEPVHLGFDFQKISREEINAR